MNFLAHIFLSYENEEILMGNLIADFIRNKEVANYSEAIQQGIQLHRQIDSYTDNHPIVRRGTSRLRKNHQKYAPVVIDILYDLLLTRNWHLYANNSLYDFGANIYNILTRRMEDLPRRLKRRMPEMIQQKWLDLYQTKEGMQFVFDKMDERTAFPSNFHLATDDLMRDYDLLNEEFNTFFPEVIEYVTDQAKV